MVKIPVNLVYLKYFCDAVRCGSVSGSARMNFVSQSAISQGIVNLEKALGKELITHQTNLFKLTKDGQKVFEKSREVFASISELEQALVEDESKISGRIEFACPHSFALALLPRHLQQAKKKWPELHVNFRLAHTDVIKEMVKKGIVDFGFVLDNDDFTGFECREIYRGEHKLYKSKKHKMPKNPVFILSEEHSETAQLKSAYRKRYGKDLPVLMQVSSWEVIASLVEEGLGVGFIPDYVSLRKHRTLEEYPLDIKPIPYKIFALLPGRQRSSRATDAFLDLLARQ